MTTVLTGSYSGLVLNIHHGVVSGPRGHFCCTSSLLGENQAGNQHNNVQKQLTCLPHIFKLVWVQQCFTT